MPLQGRFSQVGFDEGNAEQYVWYVPQNIAGLVTALGGRQTVADRLDRITQHLNAGPMSRICGPVTRRASECRGCTNYVGQPWKTHDLVDRVRSTLFAPTPDGEPGNDDLGAMSSWYVWAALGLYPSVPGTPILTVNTPLFDRVESNFPQTNPSRFRPGRIRTPPLEYFSSLHIDRPAHGKTYLPESIVRHRRRACVHPFDQTQQGWGTAESSAPPSSVQAALR